MTKIYVLKWSEIFDEFSKRHEYLLDKLKLEEELWLRKHNSADEVVADAQNNSAIMEMPLIPKKARLFKIEIGGSIPNTKISTVVILN